MWILLWLVGSLFVGGIGSSTKLGFWGAFFISLLLSPVIGFIIAIVLDKEDSPVKTVEQKAAEPKKSIESRLFDLKELKEKRLITDEEYDRMRQDILKDA